MKIILISLIGLIFGQYDYSLLDNNPTSGSYQEYVGPEYFSNEITMHYFGSFTWGLCSSRFAQLNDVYENLLNNGYSQVKLVGIGYGSQSSSTGNWPSWFPRVSSISWTVFRLRLSWSLTRRNPDPQRSVSPSNVFGPTVARCFCRSFSFYAAFLSRRSRF